MCLWRESAAVFSPEHVSLRTGRDPSVLVACERGSLSHEHVSLRTERDPSVLAACEHSGLGDPRGGDFACARAAVALMSY